MSGAWKRKEVIGDCTLYLGNCLKVMPALGHFDAVVTDPPYGIGESNKNFASRSKFANADKYHRSRWDDVPATIAHINAMKQHSRWQIIFGGNYFEGLGPTKCWLVWDKENGASHYADCELAWTNLAMAVRMIKWQWQGFIRKGEMDKVKAPTYRVHPTQKPLGVMKWCLGFLPDAQTILDPFMGSGTTGVACVETGRKFVGIELDEGYFDIACRRISEAYLQPDMLIAAPDNPVFQASMFVDEITT